MAEWATTPARKSASSRDHECPRSNKSAPSILLGNRYEVLAGSEVGVDMDVELGSLSSFLDGWAVENLMEAMGMDAAPSGAEDLGSRGSELGGPSGPSALCPVWSRRRLSLTGKVVVVRSMLLPLLLHLAYAFPVPTRDKIALTREVFRFLWCGRYEYVRRELMYAPVAGGRGVPRVPLKLDVLYASYASRVFLERVPHKCFFLARYYLAGF
ncbi:hypothetical protein AAFF_G00122370 [Aldrovandia affinis]|uniref:Uncharacterized protein n=1 Tax=Aldrovandia affinis TaxID=143900 RepID=A0AAD7W9U8_9TELE|nr:hypothetical protein AAFF_G00122370 [Aldrovandia affinis]